MDLTKEYPASVREKLLGVVQIKRTIDKGKAKAKGNIGEYHYDCPMDQAIFGFLGLDAATFLEVIKNAKSDQEISDYVKPFVAKKSSAEIDEWNAEWLEHRPDPGSDGEKYFLDLRNQVAPTRTDVTSWADLLDLDEKRPVPQRVAV
ncbi:MAG TPA: DUF5069 domain-containing protein [Candidatus Baltobacteraceae bacterium]